MSQLRREVLQGKEERDILASDLAVVRSSREELLVCNMPEAVDILRSMHSDTEGRERHRVQEFR